VTSETPLGGDVADAEAAPPPFPEVITGRGEEGARRAPKPPVTGDQAVDEALDLIADTFGAELDLQLEVYESAHQTLQDRLADVES